MKFVIVDIDGTISINTIRENYANSQFKKYSEVWWDAFMDPSMIHTDVPILYSILVLQEYYNRGYEIIYMTGRVNHLRDATREWLETKRKMGKDIEISFPDGRLIMTPNIYISSSRERVAVFKRAAVRKLKGMGPVDYVFDDSGENLIEIGKERIPNINLNLVQTDSEMWWKNYLYTKMGKKEYEMNRGGIMARTKKNPSPYQQIENKIILEMRMVVQHYRDSRWNEKPVTRWNHIRDIMLRVSPLYYQAFDNRDQYIFRGRYPYVYNLIEAYENYPYRKPSNVVERMERELESQKQSIPIQTHRTIVPIPEGFTTPPSYEWKAGTQVRIREDLTEEETYRGLKASSAVRYTGDIIKLYEPSSEYRGAWKGYTIVESMSVILTPEMTYAPDVVNLIRRPSTAPPPPPPSVFISPEGERIEIPRAPSRFEYLEPLYQENPRHETKYCRRCGRELEFIEGEVIGADKFGNISKFDDTYLCPTCGRPDRNCICKPQPIQFQNNPFMGEFMDYPVSKQYQSLNDKYPRGNIEIWYWKNPENNVSGKLWCMEILKGNLPTVEDIHNDYVKLGSIEATNEEDIYMKMQGEVWSQKGEARDLITRLGLSHTSMSMGDVIIVRPSGEVFVVDSFGFTPIGVM